MSLPPTNVESPSPVAAPKVLLISNRSKLSSPSPSVSTLTNSRSPPFKPAPDNPLAISVPTSTSTSTSASTTSTPAPTSTPTIPMSPHDPLSAITRDFTYLRHPQNFHPLPSQSLPAAFRSTQPAPSTPLNTLLATGHFRSAAITAANTLTDTTQDLPAPELFRLWYIRLASLTLIGSTGTAAQEIKVFSDLSSTFYRDVDSGVCLLPWELRVLAVRLQAIGFSDWRRSLGLYYELAREARAEILKSSSADERGMWRHRLRDLGVRVGSALVEMGDLKAAGRHLEALRQSQTSDIVAMLCLLYIRIGNLAAAQQCLAGSENADNVLKALFLMAEAKWETGVEAWEAVIAEKEDGKEMAGCNLAVCLLYTGRLEEARRVLESLVATPPAFPGLTFNLSTIYELCSDNSKALKMALAEQVAEMGAGEMVNSSFKM